MEYNIGDIVRTKKVHPCGSKLWEIMRVGVDFKLKCLGPRKLFAKHGRDLLLFVEIVMKEPGFSASL